LIACIYLLDFTIWPIAYIPDIFVKLRVITAVTKRIFETYDAPVERVGGQGFFENENQNEPALVFSHVDFAYKRDMVLHDICFEIKRGEKYALVGRSGSGKTTITKLITGLYEQKSGSIHILGKPIEKWDLQMLRKQISVVSQDSFLFPATIMENIAYGKPDASKDAIYAAAKMTMAHDFIQELPEGYDTVIGERGSTLSGGQRQRLALTRAIIRDTPIIIMDEPTSSLDVVTEQHIIETFNRISEGKTIIVIAHRLSTIVDMDHIIVLNEGVIVESGTYQQLLASDGTFKQIYLTYLQH
jgi:ABC-type multidrug transport system fused ATPase/permease subunit